MESQRLKELDSKSDVDFTFNIYVTIKDGVTAAQRIRFQV